MKKFSVITLSISCCIFAVLSLTACKEEHLHSYVDSVTAPTCTEQGFTTHTCECGESYIDSYISALGHDFTNYISNGDMTCTKDGTKTAKCNRANCPALDTKNDDNAKASHNWDFGKITSSATCVNEGNILYTCLTCGDVHNEKIEPTGKHTYSESVMTEATCNTQGVKKYECSQCDDFYTEKFDLASYSASEIYDLSKASVGEIITYNKSGNELALGTGFVYSADGKIVTNYHVIEDAYSAKITINGTTYTVQSVLAYDKTIDLAVLKISATGLSVLDICTKEHSVGKSVYAFGSSKGLTATFSQGIITYADREIDGVHYVQHDSAISSGNSGGPLINQFGEIIGINTMTMKDSQNLNFAISVKELSNLVYGTPLTVAEFYEKECDVFLKIKNYILQKGTYDSADNEYDLTFDIKTDSSSGLSTMTTATYDCSSQEIELSIFLTNSTSSHLLTITIDEIDGTYQWSYIDNYKYFMRGTIYASTWTSNSLLGVSSYTNIPTTSLVTSVRKVSSSMMNLLLLRIYTDFLDISLTPADLGFINY